MFNLLKKIRNRITYNNVLASRIENSIELHHASTVSFANEIENLKLMQGRILVTVSKEKYLPQKNIQDFEFKVFSQWGDDGIIQYLVHVLDIKNKFFIEFGVENYLESNTRFLLLNNNWSGFVIDGSDKNIDYIKNDTIYWKYDLTAKSSFVTKENINNLIAKEGMNGEIGLLHIDIDGVDYWIWKEIEVVQPIIVIVEYNSNFGNKRMITVPYRLDFQRQKAHYSNLFAGVSLPALVDLATKKGYIFVGCNSNGNNAYFVKSSYSSFIKEVSIQEGYVESKFREARDSNGNLVFQNGKEILKSIKNLEVYNTSTNQLENL
jgi:hypothetical protein